MLSENLRNLRKEKGMSQEELASRVFVVRQTVSKWEKGLSVPDADALQKLAEVLEVPVSKLLGAPVEQPKNQDELAEQLARINEQLVIRNRRGNRIWGVVRGILIAIGALILLYFLIAVVGVYLLGITNTSGTTVTEDNPPAVIYYDEETGGTSIGTLAP